MEGIDLHAEELPFFSALKIPATGTQFFPYAVVAIDTLMNLRCGIDRQFDAFAERTHGAYMIGMVVGDKHPHDILKIQTHLAETFLYLARRDTGIDEDTLTPCTEEVTVPATPAGKAPKNKSVFFHIVKNSCKITAFF